MNEIIDPCKLIMSDEMLTRVASRFQALGEPYRLRILRLLRRGAMTVGEVVESLRGNQPNITRHLQILFRAGIVGRQKAGNTVIYTVKDPTVFTICDLVHRQSEKMRGHEG